MMFHASLLLTTLACLVAPAAAVARDAPRLLPMPEALEIRFALSALPARLRDDATVHVLDPSRGYRIARTGRSGIECLVERTPWELGELRNDIYIPLCYDRAGAETLLRVKRDAATLRAQGMDAAALKAEIEKRWADATYRAPPKPGLSYMLAPLMRTIGPPDLRVQTMAMPHLMFYAPGLTNADIGAKPDLADPASLMTPFVDRQGHDAQSYIIQMTSDAEKARIVDTQHDLLHALCKHDGLLCLTDRHP
jgi:hypothetical protein